MRTSSAAVRQEGLSRCRRPEMEAAAGQVYFTAETRGAKDEVLGPGQDACVTHIQRAGSLMTP